MRRFLIFIFCLFSLLASSQPTVTVNAPGQGATVTVNAPGQGSSVTINKQSEYFAPQTGVITFTDVHFQYSINGYAGTGYTARSPAGFVELRTFEISLDIVVGGNWSTASSSFDSQSECQVLIDGVYYQSVTLTSDNTTQTYTISLPAGEKIVTLVNGYTANGNSVTLPENGVYVQGIETAGTVEIRRPVTPIDKWLFIGNSITTGASSTHPTVTGFTTLFRADGLSVQADSWGGRRLLTTTVPLASEMAAFVSAQLNGSVTNTVVIFLGTNNYGLSTGHTAAQFVTWYGLFLDALHDLRPDITIYCVSPLNRTSYDTPNPAGSDLQDYADAMVTMVSDRAAWGNIFYINGKPLVDLANMPEGLHPNDTGHIQLFTNLKPLLGL